MAAITPIRRQYLKIKQRYPEAIVFFRLGDFYETFDEDAKVASQELEIALTSREMGKGYRVPMAGIPFHTLNSYLGKLVNRGYKVAICEQLGPPGKGLVEREVVQVVTPGTLVDPSLIDSKSNNYLVSLIVEGEEAGLSYVDITTGEFGTTQLRSTQIPFELERLQPSEILLPQGIQDCNWLTAMATTRLDSYWFNLETAKEVLLSHFQVSTLEGYGCAVLPLAIRASGAIIHYLQETQKAALERLTGLTTYSTQSFMTLDAQTRKNLEIFETSRWGGAANSLLSVIDLTKTAMGGRLLKKWLGQPLSDVDELKKRHEVVAWFCDNSIARRQIMSLLQEIADIERLLHRVKGNLAKPEELIRLSSSLAKLPDMRSTMKPALPLDWLLVELKPCPDVVDLISRAIAVEPFGNLGEGGVIKEGFNEELDSLRRHAKEAKQYLTNLERQERERTGIKSLKVGYNQVFGYYIEVSKPNLKLVPENYIRKQTLSDAERFFTPELKEYESLISAAQERVKELEESLFRQICRHVGESGERILATARALAQIDVFASLAEVATRHKYIRPELTEEDVISISGGRHPVVERNLDSGSFIPNDTYLCNKDAQIIILTGPNMSGKSTYIRQVALIVLLAQIGSFVPADAANIGVVDRIFTRIGAQEDLAAGQSTFMVEMVETANILNNATSRSLIILDEIGRGTSTYDGLSIAWAVTEFIHNHPRLGAKTMFATHYHELVELAQVLPRVRNFNVAVSEEGGKVVFLRKVVSGGADKSYGVHVAQLAGLPKAVIHRAQEVLLGLEGDHIQRKKSKSSRLKKELPQQLALFDYPALADEIAELDVDSMSPLDAVTKLYELRQKARKLTGGTAKGK